MAILLRRGVTIAAAVLLAGATAAAAGPLITVIPNGPVEMRPAPNAPWRAVHEGETVTAGAEVRTHADSMALLRFPDGSRVQLSRATIFGVDKTNREQTSFSLKLGDIRAAFAGLFSSRITIRTPTAVCAVRGTVFELGATPENTKVNMAEGVLEVKDNQGQKAVVTSEESMTIGQSGMEPPHLVPLDDERALPAVRPYQVGVEQARDATRTMLEDLRNRELKANEAQLGKDVIDAEGRRVRLEEYLLRPDDKSFKLLFLSKRQDRFDWGHLIENFHATIPDDLSQVPAIVSGAILAKTQPTNWMTSMEFYATNTVDAEREKITLGAPTQIDFSGFGYGTRWYPGSIDFVQTLFGPGVPGGQRDQFIQHQDWNTSNANRLTWYQSVQPNATTTANPLRMITLQLDPTNSVDVANGYTSGVINNSNLYNNTNTYTSLPSGPGFADQQSQTVYSDNSSLTGASDVTVRKTLVTNDGKILSFKDANAKTFTENNGANLDINIKSSLFQGRDIDVLIAPEILRAKKSTTDTGKNIGS